MDKESYAPKFKVGDVVSVWESTSGAWRGTVTGRRVTRNAKRCDTYYEIRPDNGDVRMHPGAWEVALSATTEWLAPGAVLARILPMFDAPVYVLTVASNGFTLVLNTSDGQVKFFATLDHGNVQTLGEWRWEVLRRNAGTAQSGTAPNLGGAVVDAWNTLHGHVKQDRFS